VIAVRRRLFDLRFQKATRKLESGFHQFKHERHRLAQLMTLQRAAALSAGRFQLLLQRRSQR
jgi:large subunit ribosomal protein L29